MRNAAGNDIVDYKVFPTIIKKIMFENNLRQIELASMLNIRQSQVSSWANGKSLPNYSSLKRLCQELDLSVDQVFACGD